jgi:predicted DNA-binding transcriptional regulator AlpA
MAATRESERDHETNDNRVLSFQHWCELNSISVATGRRIIKSGKGPPITRLSARRIGISVAANADWQESRTCWSEGT